MTPGSPEDRCGGGGSGPPRDDLMCPGPSTAGVRGKLRGCCGLKLASLAPGLVIGLGLTAVGEEERVSGWPRSLEDHPSCDGRVRRANRRIPRVPLGGSAAVAVPRGLAALEP